MVDPTVLATPVSVPVMKKRLGMHGAGGGKLRRRFHGRANNRDEPMNVCERHCAGERYPDTSRARWNRRRTDRLRRKPVCLQALGHVERTCVAPKENRNDLAGARAEGKRVARQAVAQ